jgi:hypothetical protein
LKLTYTPIYYYVNVRNVSVGRKMNLLKSIKIAGKRYKVKSLDFKKRDSTDTNIGGIYYLKSLIEIDSTIDKQTQEAAMLHEIIHAICYEYGIKLKECDIHRLESGLLQVIKDNKLF